MKSITIYISLLLSIMILHNAYSQEAGDAVFNKLLSEYTLNDDGSISYHEYK
jgi:Ca2+-binding EF-hand superfamily protein